MQTRTREFYLSANAKKGTTFAKTHAKRKRFSTFCRQCNRRHRYFGTEAVRCKLHVRPRYANISVFRRCVMVEPVDEPAEADVLHWVFVEHDHVIRSVSEDIEETPHGEDGEEEEEEENEPEQQK